MSNLIPFQFESYSLRVITGDNGEPLFVGAETNDANYYLYESKRQIQLTNEFSERMNLFSNSCYIEINNVVFSIKRNIHGFQIKLNDVVISEFNEFSKISLKNIEKALANISGHKLDENGCIYLISDGEFTKIGATTYSVGKRLNELQTGNAKHLRLLGHYEVRNKISTESFLHKAYETNKVRGEWFNLSEQSIFDILSNRKDVQNKFRFHKISKLNFDKLISTLSSIDFSFKDELSKLFVRYVRSYEYTPYEKCMTSMLSKINRDIKRHGSGAMIQQVKWSETVLPYLNDILSQQEKAA